ncbi:MAG: class I SAM-dependent methyltransferase [Terriglobia bacterium]
MAWWELPRIAEPEVMDESEEVEAYASATAQAYLDKIDDSFIEHALRLGVQRGQALDIGTGPGQIPLKIARRLPELEFLGVDRSEAMLAVARRSATAAGLADRIQFAPGDGNRLELTDASFDLVICNSVLHHLANPVAALKEIGRVVKPTGAILVRDLRRPSRLAFPPHVRWYGRHYTGKMKELYVASVRSAYTRGELGKLVRQAQLDAVRLFRFGRTHIGVERCAKPPK